MKQLIIPILILAIVATGTNAACIGSECNYTITTLPYNTDVPVEVGFTSVNNGTTIYLLYDEWLSGTDAYTTSGEPHTFIAHVSIPANVTSGTYTKKMYISTEVVIFNFYITEGANITNTTQESSPDYCNPANMPNPETSSQSSVFRWWATCEENLSETYNFLKNQEQFSDEMNMSFTEFRTWWEAQTEKVECEPVECVCSVDCAAVRGEYSGWVKPRWKYATIILLLFALSCAGLHVFKKGGVI